MLRAVPGAELRTVINVCVSYPYDEAVCVCVIKHLRNLVGICDFYLL